MDDDDFAGLMTVIPIGVRINPKSGNRFQKGEVLRKGSVEILVGFYRVTQSLEFMEVPHLPVKMSEIHRFRNEDEIEQYGRYMPHERVERFGECGESFFVRAHTLPKVKRGREQNGKEGKRD